MNVNWAYFKFVEISAPSDHLVIRNIIVDVFFDLIVACWKTFLHVRHRVIIRRPRFTVIVVLLYFCNWIEQFTTIFDFVTTYTTYFVRWEIFRGCWTSLLGRSHSYISFVDTFLERISICHRSRANLSVFLPMAQGKGIGCFFRWHSSGTFWMANYWHVRRSLRLCCII